MPDTPGASPVSDEELERDEDDPGEIGTSFATKGSGWSGRDDEDEWGSVGGRWPPAHLHRARFPLPGSCSSGLRRRSGDDPPRAPSAGARSVDNGFVSAEAEGTDRVPTFRAPLVPGG